MDSKDTCDMNFIYLSLHSRKHNIYSKFLITLKRRGGKETGMPSSS